MSTRRFAVLFAALALLAGGCASAGTGPHAEGEGEPIVPDRETRPIERAPELSPEVRAGERVVGIRLDADPIVLLVGEDLDLWGLNPTPVDENGDPVPEVRVLVAPLQTPTAVLEDGILRGDREGETRLALAVMAPGSGGMAEPRVFAKRVVVHGPPVSRLEIVPPELGLYTGTAVAFGVRALAADGAERTRVETRWTSRNPDVASVGPGGIVRGHRAGRATIVAHVEGVEASHVVEVSENPVRVVELSPEVGSVRTGDVLRFRAVPRDASGAEVGDIALVYGVSGEGMRADLGASIHPDGAFVAERPGTYQVVVTAGGVAAGSVVHARPRDVREDAVQVGVGLVPDAPSSDLWVFRGRDGRDYAYVGTHAGGQKMYVWDVTDPASPVRTDSVVVDARVVNDVKVNADATLAVITREGASDRRNGIVLLDLEDPAHPEVITSFTDGLTGGVHNTFIVGDLVYAVHNGTADVHIIDVADPTRPREVGRWGIERSGRYLHDFWVVDGIGYASYWDDGVWIVDVGDGRWGGTPTEPRVISSFAYGEGNTHVAFPYRNSDGHTYLFVGDEIFDCEECISRAGPHEEGPRGFVHVLSIDDPENPVEVGRYEVPEAGVHNLWVTDDRLYAAYYQGGLRVVDVSGELRGDLYRQGREIAWFPTGHPDAFMPNSPMAWGPQPYRGHVFVSDLNSGLWVVRIEPRPREPTIP